MISVPSVIDMPLQADETGTIRVGGTRVTLESVIGDFHRGATPEDIVHNFPVLKLADIYYVVGYYLANQAQVDTYIEQQRQEGEQLRREWEAEHPSPLTKADLLVRLEKNRKQSGKG